MADRNTTDHMHVFANRKDYNSSNVVTLDTTYDLVFDIKVWRTTSKRRDWKQRIQRGLDASTVLNAGRRNLSVTGYGSSRDSIGGSSIARREWVGSPQMVGSGFIPSTTETSFNETIVSTARDQAYINLVNSYRSAVSKFQSGPFLGELKEAIMFLKRPAKSLERLTTSTVRTLARDLRRLGGGSIDGKSSAALRAATDSVLAYNYAAKPLVSDINNADKALTEHYKRRPFEIVRIRGDGSATKRTHSTGAVTGTHAYFKKDKWEEVTVRFLGGYKCQNQTGPMGALQELALTPDNWAPTAWELFPFSFVADYFSNVGKVIDAHSFQLVDLAWLNETVRQKLTYELSSLSHSNAENGFDYANQTNYSSGGRVLDKHFLVARHPFTNNWIPSFTFKLPGLGQDLNLAALLNSFLELKT